MKNTGIKSSLEHRPRKMHMVLKVLGVILAIVLIAILCLYFYVLRYPNLKDNPRLDKWYRVSGSEMKSSDGNPFKDWTVIMFPYATGDFHCGTGEFSYTENDGKEKTLYHNGYTNFTSAMGKIMKNAGIDNPESKTVLIDSSLLLNNDWYSIATDVWQAPKHISDRLVSNNITLDSLTALHEKYGDDVNILFDSSTRDGDLAKVQNYFDTGVMDVDDYCNTIQLCRVK